VEIGFNDDVSYRGLTFHIQTEDHGHGDERVSTQIFLQGRILDSKTVSYAHLLVGIADDEERRAKIRKVMVAAHRNLHRRLISGDYDVLAGLDPHEEIGKKTVELSAIDDFQPSQARVPESAIQVLEEDGKVTFTFDHGEAVDLKALGRELNKINVMPPEHGGAASPFADLGFDEEDEEDEVPEPPTRAPRARRTRRAEDEEGLLPLFSPTGHRAFQGLLEPESRFDTVAMVREFLQRLERAP
jgi:hypothetical protein